MRSGNKIYPDDNRGKLGISAKSNFTCQCLNMYLSDLRPAARHLQGKFLQVLQARSIPYRVPCNQACHIHTWLAIGVAKTHTQLAHGCHKPPARYTASFSCFFKLFTKKVYCLQKDDSSIKYMYINKSTVK